jgi:hypothetical protein
MGLARRSLHAPYAHASIEEHLRASQVRPAGGVARLIGLSPRDITLQPRFVREGGAGGRLM